MASRTMSNLFSKHKGPVGTGVLIMRKQIYLHRDGRVSHGVRGLKFYPDRFFMMWPPAIRRSIRKQLRAMGHNELVLQSIPPKQMSDRVINAMADDGPYGRIV